MTPPTGYSYSNVYNNTYSSIKTLSTSETNSKEGTISANTNLDISIANTDADINSDIHLLIQNGVVISNTTTSNNVSANKFYVADPSYIGSTAEQTQIDSTIKKNVTTTTTSVPLPNNYNNINIKTVLIIIASITLLIIGLVYIYYL